MGLLRKILSVLGFDGEAPANTVSDSEPENLSGKIMEENNDTLIFTGEPDMNTAIGVDGQHRMSPNMIVANSQINNNIKVADEIGARPARPREQAQPQMAPSAPAQQPRQMAPSAPVQQPRQVPPQQPVQQPYVNPYARQPQYQYQQPQYYGQQPMYQQPQQPMYQQPQPQYQYPQQQQVEQQDAGAPEPYSERILINDVYHLYVDLPGVKKQGLSVRYVNSEIEISGQRSSMIDTWRNKVKGNKGKKPVFESQCNIPDFLLGKFKFSFYFPLPIDETTVKAELEEGALLHVSMRLRASAGGITISVT